MNYILNYFNLNNYLVKLLNWIQTHTPYIHNDWNQVKRVLQAAGRAITPLYRGFTDSQPVEPQRAEDELCSTPAAQGGFMLSASQGTGLLLKGHFSGR